MTELAVTDDAGLEVSAVDVERDGVTFTIDTLRDLAAEYADSDLVLVLGTDSALSMDRWERAVELAGMCEVLVIGRPGQTSFM